MGWVRSFSLWLLLTELVRSHQGHPPLVAADTLSLTRALCILSCLQILC